MELASTTQDASILRARSDAHKRWQLQTKADSFAPTWTYPPNSGGARAQWVA